MNISEAYNEVFNFGADKPYSVNELVTVVSKEFGVEPNIKHLSAKTKYCMLIPITQKHIVYLATQQALTLKKVLKECYMGKESSGKSKPGI